MADEDARRGFRALISGGMAGMDDDAVDRLQEATAQTQRDRGRAPKLAEVEYLEEYSKICERRLNLELSLWGANQELAKLNEKFSTISESIKRTQVAGPEELVNQEDIGWMGSSYAC